MICEAHSSVSSVPTIAHQLPPTSSLFRGAGPRHALGQSTGLEPEVLETLAIADHEASLRADIERLRASDLVPSELEVSAHLYDVTSGQMTQVVSPAPLNKE